MQPNEVKEVAKALSQISLKNLRSHFIPKVFNAANIYPNPQLGGGTMKELETLLPIFVH